MNKALLRETVKKTFSIFFGYFFLGIGFGVLFRESGASVWQTFLTALLVYAGSLQYALVGLLRENASLLTITITALAVNSRYFFYGLSMLEKYQKAGRYKTLLLFWMSDETVALIHRDKDDESENRFQKWLYLSAMNHLYWIFSCTLGALLGNFLPFSSKGIEFVMTALFTTIFLEQWLYSKDHVPAISALVVTTICLFVFSRENFLLISLIILTLASMVYGKRRM